jgi:sialidase-1
MSVMSMSVGMGWGAPPETIELNAATRERCLQVLREGLASEEFWPAMHAAEGLTYAGLGSEVLAGLAKRTAADDQQRCGLAREAVRAGDRQPIAKMLAILEDEKSIGRVHAAESLFKVAEVGNGVSLRAAAGQDRDLKLRLMAEAALARCGHPTALSDVRKYLSHDDVEVRKSAIWILGQIGSQEDVAPIERMMATEQEPLTRAYCAHALALQGNAAGRAALGQNLLSDVPAVRTYAADIATFCRATEYADRLIKQLDDAALDARIRAAQALVVMAQPRVLEIPLAAKGEDISRDVYPATAANPRYSEGSVIALTDSTLLYATTEFVGGGADHATARIVGRTSKDRGRTWSEPKVLQENTGKQNVMSVTLRRLKPDAISGPLGMFYLVKNGPDDLKAYLRVSNDEAATFGSPILVTNAPGYHVMNNDRVTVLSSGRLVCPIARTDDVFKKGSGHFVSFCYLSDDEGKTWRKSADQVDQPKRGAMEPEVIEISDNDVLMIIRTQDGKIATSKSSDGGDHWSAPGEFSVPAPESPATIRRIPATGDLLLVWNNTYAAGANHAGKRTPLTAAVSSDGGKTWRQTRNLETDANAGYAYTSIAFHRDRALLSYYVADEKTGRISSRFRSVPVRWFYESP